jgi:hypothetical protein
MPKNRERRLCYGPPRAAAGSIYFMQRWDKAMDVATLQLYALWTVAAIGAAGFCLAWWLM